MTTPARYEGGCHCGAVRVAFETAVAPEALAFRKCGCDFCRRMGAIYVSDPEGRLTFTVKAADGLRRYRFATEQAEFISCVTCGTYLGAVEAEGQALAVLNAHILDGAIDLPQDEEAVPTMDYDGEAAPARKGRWSERWTPARIEIAG